MSRPRLARRRPLAPAGVLPLLAVTVLVPVLAPGASASAAGLGPTSACTDLLAGLSVYGGSNQVAKTGSSFSSPLAVQAVDTGGCPMADVQVQFAAPSAGATAGFAGGASSATVATGANGVATAPTLTADEVSGTYSVVATSGIFTASFSLTNSTVAQATTVTIAAGSGQAATVGSAFAQSLAVVVSDPFGDPVAGASVDFQVAADKGATASFASGGTSAVVQTGYDGRATAPQLLAGSTSGTFTVTATLAGTSSGAAASGGAPATFSLTDVAGQAYAVTAGVGTSQTAQGGTAYAVPLAVTVTDVDGNPVTGATVTFAAPPTGATGVFVSGGRTAVVSTGPTGTATAPTFVAGQSTGGYVVTASVAGVAQPATFAMVDAPRTSAAVSAPPGTYRLVTSGGRVLSSGGAVTYVAHTGLAHVVAMAATPDGKGYWVATAQGKLEAYGDAHLYGTPTHQQLTRPVVAMAATPDGKGYWLVDAGGGVFAYGDAAFYGSAAGLLHPAGKESVVAVAPTSGGRGYWLATSSGAVFAFGDATFYGSSTRLSFGRVATLVPTRDGGGYWLVGANGTCAGFGDAGGQGTPTVSTSSPVVAGAA